MRNKKLTTALFILFLLLVLAYAGYTARHIILGPQLILGTEGDVLTVTSQIIEIAGTAHNTTKLTMNNATILLDEMGSFRERMLLSVGVNIFIFDAEDKFGRQSQETLKVLYTPKDNDVLQLKNNDITNTNIINNGKEESRPKER